MCNFSIATTDKWKDKSGEQQERTEWHRIATFNKLAEICGEYLKKGSQVYIEGRLQTRSYDDKDGQKKYVTEVVAEDVILLGGRGGEGGGPGGGDEYSQEPAPRSMPRPRAQAPAPAPSFNDSIGDDDVPF